jgi:Domain of unknown function (DUF4465)/Secretion system C-terminal sorting domain
MKKSVLTVTASVIILSTLQTTMKAQTISTFEENILEANTFWDGSLTPGGTIFTSGNAIFPNNYDTSFFYWASDWAYSNVQDSTTIGYTNLFAAFPAIGYNNSTNYAIGQQNAIVRLSNAAAGNIVNGISITNGTFAALSMTFGDDYAKKFGGETGNDPDYFILRIRSYYNGILSENAVEFYLADFTFENNEEDYIVKDWQYVDLTSLGNTDSLLFNMASSDEGDFGINTPLFFCIDDLITSDGVIGIEENNNKNLFSIFPNPASNNIIILSETKNINKIQISDVSGKQVYVSTSLQMNNVVNINFLENGIYFISATIEDEIITKRIIKY